jgi:hypothetical protein
LDRNLGSSIPTFTFRTFRARNVAVFFGSICLFGSDHGCSFPSKGATHRFPSSADRFVDVIFGCADLPLRALRQGVVWTCSSLATIGVPIARALDLQQSIGQLYHTGRTAKDGLPGIALALAQTADGYLWVGTTLGLYRFTGGCLSAVSCWFYSWQVQCLQ